MPSSSTHTTQNAHAQTQAADPFASAWVSASAGSGKTKVLTDRVLRLLLAGAEPHMILCLTFTKAAAAEMENRLTQRLSRWAILSAEELAHELESLTGAPSPEKLLQIARHLLARTLDAPRPLQIQTIHGFCQTLLKKFPLEAGIPPRFDVLDPFVSGLLLKEVEAQIFHRAHAPQTQEDPFTQAVRFFMDHLDRSRFEEVLTAIIAEKSNFQKLRAQKNLAELHALQEQMLAPLGALSSETDALKNIAQILKTAPLGALITLLETTGDETRTNGLRQWLEKPMHRSLDDLHPALSFFITQTYTPRRTLLLKPQREKHPELFATLLEVQEQLIGALESLWQVRSLKFSTALLSLGFGVLDLYESLKRRRGLLDYDDLIFRALQLLEQPDITPWILYKIEGGIHHILVDEAQDTNADQWRLLTALTRDFFQNDPSGHKTLFFVGDPKQSIYSFQGANPQLFLTTRDIFAQETQTVNHPFRTVQLSVSYRSTTAVLKAVDAVFSHPLQQQSLLAEDPVTHQAHRSSAPGRVEVWPLTPRNETSEDASDSTSWMPVRDYYLSPHPRTFLAERIASVIQKWCREGRWVAGRGRSIQPGDILILVRQRGPFVEEMVRALKAHHVPVAGVDRLLLSDHIAVQDLLALLRFILCPTDDLSCAEVLKGPLVGLDESELFHLATTRGAQSLWQTLEQQTAPTYQRAAADLAHIRAQMVHKAPYDALATFLDALGGRAAFIARLGLEAEDPLDECLTLASIFEQTIQRPGSTLQDFTTWLSAAPIEIKRDLQEGDGASVRIMTVHGAKGLQAPIVFLPDTIDLPQSRGNFLWHGTPALPFWRMPAEERPTTLSEWIASEKDAAMAEYDRLLYVALTRAEDELYIAGWEPRGSPNPDSWYLKIRESLVPFGADIPFECPLSGEVLTHLALHDPETFLSKSAAPQSLQEHRTTSLPEWVTTPPPAYIPPQRISPSSLVLPHPLSHEEEVHINVEEERQRGIFIHRLLEMLPHIPREYHKTLLPRLGGGLSPALQELYLLEVQRILDNPELSFIFTSPAQTEVDVAGFYKNVWVEGRIDRLVFPSEDNPSAPIWIIDYKTGAVDPDHLNATAYAPQLQLYRALLLQNFPNHDIKMALLWTRPGKLSIL